MFTGMESIIGLFPGQGSYRPHHLRAAWYRGEEAVCTVFDAVDTAAQEILGKTVTTTVFSEDAPGPDELLAQDPDILQLAVFGLSAAAYRLLKDRGARMSALVGHSMGEVTALACAGAWTLTDSARILCHRISALRQFDHSGGQMLALSCDEEKARQFIALVADPDLLVAVRNSAGQTVLSGPDASIRTVAALASTIGITAIPLRSPHPFHNPLLAAARTAFAGAIGAYSRYPLNIPVYSPILQRWYRDGDDLAALLGLHLVTPLYFDTAVDRLHEHGARVFVELGAGAVLGRLVESSHPDCVVLQPLDGRYEERALADTVAYLPGSTAAIGRGAPAEKPARPVLPPQPSSHAPTLTNGAASAQVLVPDAPPAPAAPSAPAATAAPAASRAPAAPPAQVPPSEPSSSSRPAEPVGSREAILSRIQTLYAEALEYPEEVMTEDALLEAELGVDSVKQTQLLGQVRQTFGLEADRGQALSEGETLGKIVDYVWSRVGRAEVSA
ncbi:acyltransferase domain-containing protein [Actinoallomurus spadix]|uniref:[acyl-carrier-protein] S-malonyltransferase n=1 Tax=Actinoallomurus spadix TaxID=79912 RepID=A0ABN0WXT4_9ACTN|nr:acyltransferase domain-containing protein [Actinoallomurus spadix]MCO5989590.1 acyltransferase domain-containing protein [Actinoallomurus spadix]